MDDLWTDVDAYVVDALLAPDAGLDGALQRSKEGGLPEIAVAPNQGKLLQLLVRMSGAKRVLEVGTLGGYSTIWLARAAERVTTLELDQHHADVARANLTAAGITNTEVLVGPAAASLEGLEGPYDFVFIDADKPGNPVYVEHALRLSRPGTVIVVDNTIRQGKIVDPANDEPAVVGTRALYDLLRGDNRVDATAVQTVGSKGHDGFVLAIVR
ncbi:MAG: methyltransferase [Frankiales bacterium]|nr:methyltransferase [Frankiales bacterium]